MTRQIIPAVAYFRTSSAANVGVDKDSVRRQQEAVEAYASGRYTIGETFYEPSRIIDFARLDGTGALFGSGALPSPLGRSTDCRDRIG